MGGKSKCCEMMIPKDERYCWQRDKQLTSRRVKLLLCFVFLASLLCTGSSCNTDGKVPVGKIGILWGTSGALTPVAITEAALDQFLKSHSANDKHGMVQMIATGMVFSVDNGTKVLVIDYGEGMFKRKIRILEGEMEGRAGYIPYEWVKPLRD